MQLRINQRLTNLKYYWNPNRWPQRREAARWGPPKVQGSKQIGHPSTSLDVNTEKRNPYIIVFLMGRLLDCLGFEGANTTCIQGLCLLCSRSFIIINGAVKILIYLDEIGLTSRVGKAQLASCAQHQSVLGSTVIDMIV